MLIAIAAAVIVSTQPILSDEEYQAKLERNRQGVADVLRAEADLIQIRTSRCGARIMEASAPGVRYDRSAPNSGALDRQPDRGEARLFSAVELKVGGCSLPVIRARAADPVVIEPVVPLDR